MKFSKTLFYTLLLCTIITSALHATTTLLSGVIQFPSTISQIPDIDLFCEGRKIITQISNHENRIHYALSRSHYQRDCCLAITQSINLIGKDETSPTYDYQKIDITKPYKFYTLTFEIKESQEKDQEQAQPLYQWIIKEQSLELSQGRLPDNTLIVRYDPNLIEKVHGGTALELPTIVIRPDVLTYLGSEEVFNDVTTKLSCASPDYRSLYTAGDQHIKRYSKKVVVLTS